MQQLEAWQKEQCVLRYRNGENATELANEYSTTRSTIWRWDKRYDGTIASLELKKPFTKPRHPKQMPVEEEQRIIEIVTENPQITNKQLALKLGTNRHPAALHRKREKLLGKRIIYHKYEYSTLFSKQKVDDINNADLAQGSMSNNFYVIEVVPDLFLRINESSNPVCITPYLSVALKFQNEAEANAFVCTLSSDDMRWVPHIRQICKNNNCETK